MSGRGRPRKDRDDNPGLPKAKSPPTTRKKSTPRPNELLEDKKTTAKAKKLQESPVVCSRDAVSPEGPRKPKPTRSVEKKAVGSVGRANSIEENPSKAQQRAPEKLKNSEGSETDKKADAKARCPIKAQDSQEAHPRKSPKTASCTEEPQIPKRAKSGEKKAALTRRGSSIDGNPSKTLQNALEKLKVKKSQRSEAAECVNTIQETITDYLKQNLTWCKDISPLKTGSYYENVKICKPDEFDVMLTVRVDRVNLQPFSGDGAFYSVEMKRQSPRHPLDKFVNEDKTIMASEMLNDFRQKIKEALGTLPYVSLERKKMGCPAVTLLVKDKKKEISIDFVLGLEVHSSWPDFTKEGFKIENWLGKNERMEQRREPFYLVPKYEGRGNTEQDGVMAKDAWRISFSHVEKCILKKHGNSRTCCQGEQKCCRKQCLKLLKFLFQRLKEVHPEETEKLCSYHAKTTLFHACAERVKDSDWAFSELSHCFQQLVNDFEHHLRAAQLPNFFIPSQNLLSCISKKHCNRLADYIESQRNNGFPLLA